ncbi:MAG: ParB N-terminal domain-containing protein [Oscillospiraceae bacterium]|nr:ParB N-terminal domain-containing protein [Oscillospiraceae bacterium]
MKIIEKKISNLKPYENNPRFNDKSIDALANSIKEFGFNVPLVIDKNGEIICGHTRLKAAKKLGLTEVPCIIKDDLNEEQIKAFRLADNKIGELSEWDFSKLKIEIGEIKDINLGDLGFFDFEIDTILNKKDTENDEKFKEYDDMPMYVNEDKSSFLRLIVNFENENDIADFAKLVNQKITSKTKSIWYPPHEEKNNKDFIVV